jgi:hypothetical protein
MLRSGADAAAPLGCEGMEGGWSWGWGRGEEEEVEDAEEEDEAEAVKEEVEKGVEVGTAGEAAEADDGEVENGRKGACGNVEGAN